MLYGKSFKHNGLPYVRDNETVLLQLVNDNKEYIEMSYKIPEGSGYLPIQLVGLHLTKEQSKGHIFVLSKEVYKEKGIRTVIKSLKEEFPELDIPNNLKEVII